MSKVLKRIKEFVLFCAISTLLFACSGGTCPSGTKTGLGMLLFSSPNEYPAGVAVTIPVVVTNYGTKNLTGVTYSTADNTTGATLTITPASLSSCASLPTSTPCTLMVEVTNNSVPGSFKIISSYNDVATQSTNSNLSTKSLQSNVVLTSTVTLGLTQLPASNGESGINGVTFYYDNIVSLPNESAGTMLFTMVVTSANAGVFNTLDLTVNGSPLNYTVLTGNSGTGLTALTIGSVVTLSVPIPSGATQISFTPVLKQNGVAIAGNSSTASPITIPVLRPSSPPQANVIMVPSNFSLNESNSTQEVTLINNGNGPASSLGASISSASELLTISSSTCPRNGGVLESNATCKLVVTFRNAQTSIAAGTNGVVVNYNNGITNSSDTSTFSYLGKLAKANLAITSGSNPNFNFSATTMSSLESSIITLTNTGVTTISNLSYTWPPKFKVVRNGVNNACGLGLTLQPNDTCNIALVYEESRVTPNTTDSIQVNYDYPDVLDHNITRSGTSAIAVSYQTLQSQATLSFSASTYNFGSLLNNGIKESTLTLTINNTGSAPTDGAITVSSPTSPYSIVTNNCQSAIPVAGSCTLIIKSGPIESTVAAGTLAQALNVSYVPYTSANAVTTSVNISTQVVAAQSAIITATQSTSSGFSGGTGSNASPYQIESGTSTTATITYTISNSGNVPAESFNLMCGGSVCQSSNFAPWTIQSNTCANATIGSNSSCQVVFSLTNPSLGLNNLPLSNVQLKWVDQDSPNGQTQAFSGTDVSVNGYAPAKISYSPESVINIGIGGESTFTITLSGGYNVANQTISFTNTSGGAISTITTSPSPCVLSSSNPSCTVTMSASSSAVGGDYAITINNSGAVPLPRSSYGVHVYVTWMNVKGVNFASGKYTAMAISYAGVPYIAFQDANNGNKLSVMSYNGVSWNYVGSGGISPGVVTNLSLAIDHNNVPYVAYLDVLNSNKLYVVKFNGTSWGPVGSQPVSASPVQSTISLAINESNIPYVSYSNGSLVFSGYINSAWQTLYTTQGGDVTYTSLTISPIDGLLYVAYSDALDNKIYLMSESTGLAPPFEWIGTYVSTNSMAPSVAINESGVPYVAYLTTAGNAFVKAYNGSNWITYSKYFSVVANSISLARGNHQMYVSYANGSGINVFTNPIGTAPNLSGWNQVGAVNFNSESAAYVSMAVNPVTGYPYVGFSNVNNYVNSMFYPQQ